LSPAERRSFRDAIATVASMVAPPLERTVSLRPWQAGDLGWIVQRHGEIYTDEFGWDRTFEALVARIVADFAEAEQPGQDAWIAEVDGVRAGCVLCCRRDDRTAQLRILLVEPWARGLGIGRTLVQACIDFARRTGYDSIVLWTNDVLVAARRIYRAAGFELVDAAPHHSFGHDLVGQTWRLDLAGPAR
jgi:GNAT superfamily N-acetyltransferase